MGYDDKDKVRTWFKGAKTPFWHCKGCGADKNYACRVRCKDCDARAPKAVYDAAKRADQKVRDAAAAEKDVQPKTLRPSPDLQKVQKELAEVKEELRKHKLQMQKDAEDDGFTVAKSRAQKRKDKKAGITVAGTDATSTGPGSDGVGAQPSCTVAASLVKDQRDEYDGDEVMDDTGSAESAEVTLKAQIVQCQAATAALETLCKYMPGDEVLRTTLETKQKHLQELQRRRKAEQDASKPARRPIQDVASKSKKKRVAADKAKRIFEELEAKHLVWKQEQAAEQAKREQELVEAKATADTLDQEATELDAELAAATARLRLGTEAAPVVQTITSCLLATPTPPSHEMFLALQSAQALLVNAKAAEQARVQAAKSDGVEATPKDEVFTPDEQRVRDVLVEQTRQLHANAEAFIAAQKDLQVQQAESARHLSCLQKARTPAVAFQGVPTVVGAADGPAGGGDADGATPAVVPGTAAAEQAVRVAEAGGASAAILAAAACPVPADGPTA